MVYQARHLYSDIQTWSFFFPSKSLWKLSIYIYAHLEIQKYYTDLRFLLSFSTTSSHPHPSAWTGVPAQWDTPLSVMETACVWYTQRPGWVTATWTRRKILKYINNDWVLVVLLAQLAPLKWEREDKTVMILWAAQLSYLRCFNRERNEINKYK